MTTTPSDDLLRKILRESKTFACVGVSPNPVRPSHYVARYLRLKGFRVIPVNPGQAGTQLFGETVVASLSQIDGPVDVVDIFQLTDDYRIESLEAYWDSRCMRPVLPAAS